MKNTRHIIAILLLMVPAVASADNYVPKNETWTTNSPNSACSMPCGGHDVGMNVWVENGDLLFYISKSGMFDENNTLLKAGRWRLRLASHPFKDAGGTFSQTLCLNDGAIYIKGIDTEVRLWADVFTSKVFMEITSKTKTDATLSYESWRYKDRKLTKAECQQSSYKWNLPKDAMTYKDVITTRTDGLSFTHTNKANTVFDFTVNKQQLDKIKDTLYNPIGGIAFGGQMTAQGFKYTGTTDGVYASTDYRAWNFKATGMRRSTVSISLFVGNDKADGVTASVSKKRSARWWNEFWQRSFIEAVGKSKTDKELNMVVRNYELMRYMLGCNAYGAWPTKFNGSLFTFDPVFVDPKAPFTPDYRKWGGGTMTAQNQRLVYWPMLKSGDADMMVAQFDTYLRLLPTAVARTRHYWGHDGASFTEQLENFGLPNPAEYGKHKPGEDPGVERNAWLEYQWDTSLEFCSMILLSNRYFGTDIKRYEEMIRQCLLFYDLHYQYLAKQRGTKPLDGDGKLILYPTSGCETYKMTYNASSVIAALRVVAEQCIGYHKNNTCVDTLLINTANTILKRLPEIPLRSIDGHTCIAPAVVWARIQNVETPQLYPVFPWRVYGLGRKDIDIARDTYLYDPHAVSMRTAKGWKQDNIWAACLGLTDEAKRLATDKLTNGPYRFTAFFDPGYDWAPDCNKGGAAMIGLQEMLLQEKTDGELMLFPAWPKEWNVRFRLHATGNRTVNAMITDGKITGEVIRKYK